MNVVLRRTATIPFALVAHVGERICGGTIELLLGWHFVQIVDVQGLWVIQVPNEGPVRGFFGTAAPLRVPLNFH